MAATLSALQLFFALTWVVYVIYLPALAAQAGIDKRFVPWILMMDQAIFIACDWAAGVYADRVAAAMKRIGAPMAGATLLSCTAFLALPFVAPMAGPAPFLALTVMWSVTSSALRAPPMALVSRHIPESKQPWHAGLYLLGLGIASAVAPYLALQLKGVDPRIPFAVSSVAVATFAWALAIAERGREPKAVAATADVGVSRGSVVAAFAAVALLAGLGFQVHYSINTAPAWLRFVKAEELPQLMPVFWIGFNVAILPATWLPKRFGGFAMLAAGAAVGALSLFYVQGAPTLEALVAAQLVAGAAWAVALCAAFTAAMEAGRPGREGMVMGVLFSMLAMAALGRLASVSSGFNAQPGFNHVPAVAWLATALVAGGLAFTRGARRGSPRRA